MLTLVVAAQLPTKEIDRRHLRLSARCVRLDELTSALRVPSEGLSTEVREHSVCFETSSPSWRTVAEQAGVQAGVELRFLSCGNGATVLFGAYPVSLEVKAQRPP